MTIKLMLSVMQLHDAAVLYAAFLVRSSFWVKGSRSIISASGYFFD